MTAIEILRAASRSVPNEDYVQFMAAVEAVEETVAALRQIKCLAPPGTMFRVDAETALANVGGAA